MVKKKQGVITKHKSPTYPSSNRNITVACIGASAGGLEALEALFANMPVKSNIAFVVVSHLDPTHISLLAKLIQRFTDINVTKIKSGTRIQANCIYVLPPNKNVYIKSNSLYLVNQNKPHGMAIDYFLQSLANAKKDNAIAIILSGTGSDGKEGIIAIKRNGGFVCVQDPLSAKYDEMPQSAIDTGLADYILSPENIPEQLLKHQKVKLAKEGKITPELQQIFTLLRNRTGHDFSSYKLNTISRRIERQMYIHKIDTIHDYINFLHLNPHEIQNLLKDLLIGVTSFFRDEEAFNVLKKEILQKLIKAKSEDYTFRVWVPGCSTGEEAYSIAMIIRELMEEAKHFCNVQIFGTDIDLVALETAWSGIYLDNKVIDVPAERLKRFFIREKNSYRIKKEIRKMVIFGAQNIIKDPPFTKLDMICCRNLLIYLNSALQKKLFPLFHYSLKPRGMLFLGPSESISDYLDLFHLVVKKWKIYERKDASTYAQTVLEFPTTNHISPLQPVQLTFTNNNYPHEEISGPIPAIKKFLLDNHVKPCLVVNKKGDILYIHGKITQYVESDLQKYKNNMLDAVPAMLKKKLKIAIQKSITEHKDTICNNIYFKSASKAKLKVRILPVYDIEEMADVALIIFEDIFTSQQAKSAQKKYPTFSKMSKKILELERDLQYSKETLQTTIEKLQSNNEELQSSNEELQSTNEEIETSKKELQSLNEELVIANAELISTNHWKFH